MAERVYTINLKEAKKAPRNRRARKAVNILRSRLENHMDAEEVVLGSALNEKIWERGMQKPPTSVKVSVETDDDVVRAELFEAAEEAEEAPEEPEPEEEEEPEPEEAEEPEEADEEEVPEEEPEESVLEGTVPEVKASVDATDDVEALLEEEKEGKNRKTVIEYLESLQEAQE